MLAGVISGMYYQSNVGGRHTMLEKMETIGLIGLRKVQEDFVAVCKTLKDELANPELGPAIAEEVVKLGKDMVDRLDWLGEDLVPILKGANKLSDEQIAARDAKEAADAATTEDPAPAADVPAADVTNSEPDATGDSSAVAAESTTEVK